MRVFFCACLISSLFCLIWLINVGVCCPHQILKAGSGPPGLGTGELVSIKRPKNGAGRGVGSLGVEPPGPTPKGPTNPLQSTSKPSISWRWAAGAVAPTAPRNAKWRPLVAQEVIKSGGRVPCWQGAQLHAGHAHDGFVAVGVDRVLAAEAARSNRLVARSGAEAQVRLRKSGQSFVEDRFGC